MFCSVEYVYNSTALVSAPSFGHLCSNSRLVVQKWQIAARWVGNKCSRGRWWSEYADRKNDEEDEHVADSLLYDRSHLPRSAPPPECVHEACTQRLITPSVLSL